jgi:hypothetical protein
MLLRAQAFEGLFTLVPILLVAIVSIFLRARASRRRKQREEAARGVPDRGASVQGTEPWGAQAQGATIRGTLAGETPVRGAPVRDAERMQSSDSNRTAGPGQTAQAAQFPWQRETSEVYPKKPQKTPPAMAPFVSQRPRRSQATTRESYAYPPPMAFNQAEPEAAAGVRPRSTAVQQQVLRPSVESQMAVKRAASPKQAQNLRERMQALGQSGRLSAKETAGKGYSVSARLERLPPLKRAVIWAEILGPPGGRQ